MLYELVLAEALRFPWAITSEYKAIVASVLARRIAGDRSIDDESAALVRAGQERAVARGSAARLGAVGVLPIVGVLMPRGEAMNTSGAVSVQHLAAQFDALIADPSVDAVLLDFDSPGGSCGGVAEFADSVFAARARKPVIALSRPTMASAAYWIGSQASELIVSPSSVTAGVGVFSIHEDISGALAKAGVKVELIAYGENKTLGNHFEPLTPEGRASIRELVDNFGGLFTKAVARGRGVSPETVRRSFGGGKVFGAEAAVRLGIADRVGTFQTAVGAAARPASMQASASAVELRQRRLRLAEAQGPDLETLRLRARAAELS